MLFNIKVKLKDSVVCEYTYDKDIHIDLSSFIGDSCNAMFEHFVAIDNEHKLTIYDTFALNIYRAGLLVADKHKLSNEITKLNMGGYELTIESQS